jgi:hypothetical protein
VLAKKRLSANGVRGVIDVRVFRCNHSGVVVGATFAELNRRERITNPDHVDSFPASDAEIQAEVDRLTRTLEEI